MKTVPLIMMALLLAGNQAEDAPRDENVTAPSPAPSDHYEALIAALAKQKLREAEEFEPVQLRTPNVAFPLTIKIIRRKDGVISEEEIPLRRSRKLPLAKSQAQCDQARMSAKNDGVESGFRREPASPEKPLAIYAVDRREDGCAVMVMMGNTDDVRPLPRISEGQALLLPAETGASE